MPFYKCTKSLHISCLFLVFLVYVSVCLRVSICRLCDAYVCLYILSSSATYFVLKAEKYSYLCDNLSCTDRHPYSTHIAKATSIAAFFSILFPLANPFASIQCKCNVTACAKYMWVSLSACVCVCRFVCTFFYHWCCCDSFSLPFNTKHGCSSHCVHFIR